MKKADVHRKRRAWKNPILLLAAGAVLVSVIIFGSRAFAGIGDNDIVAYINGEPVTVREYTQALLVKRYDTYAYFRQKYGAEDHTGFWTEAYEGEVPLDRVKGTALEYITNRKVQQILARDKGIVRDISYRSIMEELKTENARRSKAYKNNQVIYGPVQYREQEYYDLIFSDMIAGLKQKLLREMTFEEEKISGYYLEHQENYRRSDTLTVYKITAGYSGHEAAGRTEAEKIMKEIKKRLEQGESPGDIAGEYTEDTASAVEFGEQSFGPLTAKGDHMASPELLEAAGKLEQGEVSEILDVNGTLIVMICTGKDAGDIITLEEAREDIQKELFEQEYAAMTDRLARDAKIVINQEVYGKLGEEYLR